MKHLIPLLSLISYLIFPALARAQTAADWATVAANPQRSSWVTDGVSGNLHVEWYRPIEAYIPQNVQLITANNKVYVSTSRGLYALVYDTGEISWRFDTQMPLGNSPTIATVNGLSTAFVGGFDKKIHALNALTGQPLWSFDGASAGYSANPVVINNVVYAANRDGHLYALDALNNGVQLWQYPDVGQPALGSIHQSPAYYNNVIYFAANDNYGYAINTNGTLKWKTSQKMWGDGFESYWPVIYNGQVIFTGGVGYRESGFDPGKDSIDCFGEPCNSYDQIQLQDLFYAYDGGGNTLTPTNIINYYKNKPYRRVMFFYNVDSGTEYKFGATSDSYPPIAWYGTHSGTRYPAIVKDDSHPLYFTNPTHRNPNNGNYDIPQGDVISWNLGSTSFGNAIISVGADDEPQSLSGGGDTLYRSICCDRVGTLANINGGGSQQIWGQTAGILLSNYAPGYDLMWWGNSLSEGYPQLEGNYGYKGVVNSTYPTITNPPPVGKNGIYHDHGDQNPLVPYKGKLFIHRSNAIVVWGTGPTMGKKDLLRANAVTDTTRTIDLSELTSRLETEVQKMITAGHLKPGYFNTGQNNQFWPLLNYFENPGDTLVSLSRAYPHVTTPAVKTALKTYIQQEYIAYFNPTMYTRIGWVEGTNREAMPWPPDLKPRGGQCYYDWNKSTSPCQSWYTYPYNNFYAMWQYAKNLNLTQTEKNTVYNLAKTKLQEIIDNYPYYGTLPTSFNSEDTGDFNAWIAGLTGYVELAKMTGDTAEASSKQTKLTSWLTLRASTFNKDSPWSLSDIEPVHGGPYHMRALNLSNNFLFLTPELGKYLHDNAFNKVNTALAEYNQVGPYWFVSRYNTVVDEGVMQHLLDYAWDFQAKAYALQTPREELVKYLDVPAFEKGDLYYINNLIATIEAPAAADYRSYLNFLPTFNLTSTIFDLNQLIKLLFK